MAAHFDVKIGIVRWGPSLHQYGDDWTSSATVTIDMDSALVEGYNGEMRPSIVKDIGRAIRKVAPNVTHMKYRRADGREGVINMATGKTYRVEQGPVRLIEIGEDGFERVNWEGVANTWVGGYAVGVTVQRNFKKFIDAMQAEGEARLKGDK